MHHFLHLATASAALQPPHSGYHMGTRRTGFEGWYHRLTLPAPDSPSFGFIYSVFDAANPRSPRHAVGVQVLGPEAPAPYRSYSPDSFWADEHTFALGHTALGVRLARPASPRAFERFVSEGFQLTSTLHQGKLGAGTSWSYVVRPKLGWGGGAEDKQYSTAGWLAALPVFEPHYQVLMAHGLASGSVTWRGRTHEFVDAPVYTEKNWGNEFPSRWFWIQCNSFDGPSACVSLTVAGGTRGVPVIGTEDVAMIALHTSDDLGGDVGRGRFYPFPNVRWNMGPWGQWRASGRFDGFHVLIEANCDASDGGVVVRVPTAGTAAAPPGLPIAHMPRPNLPP